MTALWLLADTRTSQKGVTRFFRAVGILAAVSSISMWCLQGLIDKSTIRIYTVTLTLLELSFAMGAIWTRRLCTKTCSPILFILLLLPCSAITCILGTLVSYGTLYVIANQLSGMGLTELLLVSLMGGVAMGVILYIINLPFLILGIFSPFYRDRFQTYMGLKPDIRTQDSETNQLLHETA